jgi:hypothetical protein
MTCIAHKNTYNINHNDKQQRTYPFIACKSF